MEGAAGAGGNGLVPLSSPSCVLPFNTPVRETLEESVRELLEPFTREGVGKVWLWTSGWLSRVMAWIVGLL